MSGFRNSSICCITAIAVLFMAPSAFACLNDTKTDVAEKEFRSRYNSPAADALPSKWNAPGIVALAAGAAGIGAFGAVGARRRTKPGES